MPPPIFFLQFILYLLKAGRTDALAVEEHNVIRISAEYARRIILLKHDSLIVYKNLHRILNVYVKGFADLYGKHDPSQLVYLAYYSS